MRTILGLSRRRGRMPEAHRPYVAEGNARSPAEGENRVYWNRSGTRYKRYRSVGEWKWVRVWGCCWCGRPTPETNYFLEFAHWAVCPHQALFSLLQRQARNHSSLGLCFVPHIVRSFGLGPRWFAFSSHLVKFRSRSRNSGSCRR